MAFYRSGELYAFCKGYYKIHFITEGTYGRPPDHTVHERPVLYHLDEDPRELFDIADARPEVIIEMMKAVEEHKDGIIVAKPIFDEDV